MIQLLGKFKLAAPGRCLFQGRNRSALAVQAAGLLLGGLLLADVAGAACVCGYGDGRFTTVFPGEISLDGNMNDWGRVLADLDNNSCDDQGTASPSSDRDYPIQSTGRDLVHFAYTWDDNNVYTYTERSGSISNTITFVYYADIDNDRRMESGEPVVLVGWQGNNRNIELSVASYNAANPGGDPMVDGNGYADGYTLPGSLTNTVDYDGLGGKYGSADGVNMEWAIPWSLLGIPSGTAFSFHVSSSNSTNIPQQIDDSMGGCGGGPASTQYADLTFVPDRTIQTSPQTTVYAAHSLTNTGNGADSFNFTASSSGDFAPTAIAYYQDLGTIGQYDAGTDILLSDTDGDSLVDTGSLAAGASLNLLVGYMIPSITGGTSNVSITATSSYDSNTGQSVTDTLENLSADITLVKMVQAYSDPVNGTSNPYSIPGSVMRYTLMATNTGAGSTDADSVTLTDEIPAQTDLVVSGSPVVFINGATASGLTFNAATDVSYYDGADNPVIPSADGNNVDPDIRKIVVTPQGKLLGSDGVNHPSFSIIFNVRVR